jgi:undecaprenyl-diphosphatase
MTVVRRPGRQQGRVRALAGAGGVLALAALIGVGWAVGEMLHGVEEVALLNGSVQRVLVARRETWLTLVMRVITHLGSSLVLIALVLAVGISWWWRQHTWRPLAMLTSAYAGAWVLSHTVKLLTHQPRPPASQAIGRFAGYAFPSGHATHAVVVFGMLAVLLATAACCWRRKAVLWVSVALLVGLIGASRLYLGAHWLTDVLGGYVLGAAWLCTVLTLTTTRRAREPGPKARSR